jgi:hypothetical protein
MVVSSTKKIIVIRDINSDSIEEAILILKNEPDCSGTNTSKKDMTEIKDNEYLLKEARFVINNYMKVCKKTAQKKMKRGLGDIFTMPKTLKTVILVNGFVLLTVVFLIIFVIKLI